MARQLGVIEFIEVPTQPEDLDKAESDGYKRGLQFAKEIFNDAVTSHIDSLDLPNVVSDDVHLVQNDEPISTDAGDASESSASAEQDAGQDSDVASVEGRDDVPGDSSDGDGSLGNIFAE
jgi:hypothetical protein